MRRDGRFWLRVTKRGAWATIIGGGLGADVLLANADPLCSLFMLVVLVGVVILWLTEREMQRP